VGLNLNSDEKLYRWDLKPLADPLGLEASTRQLEPYSSLSIEKLYPILIGRRRAQTASSPIGTRNAARLPASNLGHEQKIARVEKLRRYCAAAGLFFPRLKLGGCGRSDTSVH
jgi:hypothetical protein